MYLCTRVAMTTQPDEIELLSNRVNESYSQLRTVSVHSVLKMTVLYNCNNNISSRCNLGVFANAYLQRARLRFVRLHGNRTHSVSFAVRAFDQERIRTRRSLDSF
ncbi:hypothetical protein F2P81_024317 [Scophthalmus maximus]|uniref:Uncharacterized protein n=1 Tax=Scophthalmus maximus TaxID=52904 RepID=A0A6A4RTS7_SCOMX|nr:hypothetical protein F2P81_024317 [Scophthalmus maximus]